MVVVLPAATPTAPLLLISAACGISAPAPAPTPAVTYGLVVGLFFAMVLDSKWRLVGLLCLLRWG